MRLFKLNLEDVYGKQWVERIDARNEKEAIDTVYMRYGLIVAVTKVSL